MRPALRLLELFKLLCTTDAFAECGSPKRCGRHGVLSVASTVENGVTASLHVLGLGVSSLMRMDYVLLGHMKFLKNRSGRLPRTLSQKITHLC
jgi:hypothetical protein